MRFVTESATESDEDARAITVGSKPIQAKPIQEIMGEKMRKLISVLALAGILAGTGCASTSDLTAIKSDVAAAQADAAEARRIAEEARSAAAAAQSDASAAAAEARTASEKADRIFQQSLHK